MSTNDREIPVSRWDSIESRDLPYRSPSRFRYCSLFLCFLVGFLITGLLSYLWCHLMEVENRRIQASQNLGNHYYQGVPVNVSDHE